MTQYTENRPGWRRRFYNFLQRPVVFLTLMWVIALLGWYLNYREPAIAAAVIRLSHHG